MVPLRVARGCWRHQHNGVVVVVVVGGCEELWYGYMQKWVLVSIFLGGVRVSMWIVFFDDNIMIMLAAFVVCWVISVTQGTFCWHVPSLITIFAVM